MITIRLGRDGRITLPPAVRRQLGIRPGDRLEVEVDDERIVLHKDPPTGQPRAESDESSWC